MFSRYIVYGISSHMFFSKNKEATRIKDSLFLLLKKNLLPKPNVVKPHLSAYL